MARERWATEEALIRGNVDALDEVFAPDAWFHHSPNPSYQGLERFKHAFHWMRQGFQCTGIDWEEVICVDNTSVQRYVFHLKHTGTLPDIPVPPTGKEVLAKGCSVYHLKDGKIIEIIVHEDDLGFMQQLGVIPQIGQQ